MENSKELDSKYDGEGRIIQEVMNDEHALADDDIEENQEELTNKDAPSWWPSCC